MYEKTAVGKERRRIVRNNKNIENNFFRVRLVIMRLNFELLLLEWAFK